MVKKRRGQGKEEKLPNFAAWGRMGNPCVLSEDIEMARFLLPDSRMEMEWGDGVLPIR